MTDRRGDYLRSTAKLALCVAAAALLWPAAVSAADLAAFEARWGAWGEIGGAYGTDESSYGELAVFAPLWQNPDSLFFTEIRGKYFESDLIEGNFALGVRQMTDYGFNLGAWTAFDIRKTDSDNLFGQVSGGVELLSDYFDVRLNGYLPVTDPQSADDDMAEIVLDGSNIFMIGGDEVALHGVDGEIGGRLPLNGNRATLGVYGGGFWFDHEDAEEAISGGKARVELAFNDVLGAGSQFSANYAFTHDNVRGDRHLIGARLRLPIGAPPPAATEVSGQWLRMVDRIERDVDIVIGRSDEEAVEDALTNVDLDRVAYTADNGDSVTNASNAAGDNSLIIATGTIAGAQTLQGNQTLQGGGSTIALRGRDSGSVANFTAPGSRPTLNAPGFTPNLELNGSNVHVAGLDVDGEGSAAIGITTPGPFDNIVIEQTSVVDTSFAGISFGAGNSNIRVLDTTVAGGAVLGGLFFGIDSSDVTISGVTVTDVDGTAIFLGTGAERVSISDTTITDVDFGSGIGIGDASHVRISNVDITDVNSFGIIASSGNSDVSISDVTITNTGGDGIQFNDDNSDVTIARVTISNTGLASTDPDERNGISFGSNNSNVVIADTSITNAWFDGIRFGDNNSATISGVTIDTAGANGVYLGEANEITIDDSVLAGAVDFYGIHIDGTGNTLNGAGNTADGATFGGSLCEDNGNAWTGTIEFDGALITQDNCPPAPP